MREVIPGYRLFICDCGNSWEEKCRDAQTPSIEMCDKCGEEISPDGYVLHPEWLTDESGNLI